MFNILCEYLIPECGLKLQIKISLSGLCDFQITLYCVGFLKMYNS